MSDGIAQTIYSIDTNVLMDWQARYFPTNGVQMEEGISRL